MKTQLFFGLIGALLLSTGCYIDEIELDLNKGENQRLVIDAWITDLDEQQSVFLHLTTDYLKQETPTTVDNALVSLSVGDQVIDLISRGNGGYDLPGSWKAEEGREYTLRVDHDGEEYIATALLRPKPLVQNVRAEIYDGDDEEENHGDTTAFEVYFDLRDHPGEGDGYFGREYQLGKDPGLIVDEAGWISDDFIDGLLLRDLTLENTYLKGEKIIVEFHSVGKAAADYFTNLDLVRYREGLFDPPPYNIATNISNGAVGFFVMSAVYVEEVGLDQP